MLAFTSSVNAVSLNDFGSRFRMNKAEIKVDKIATREGETGKSSDERHLKLANLFDVMLKRYDAAVLRLTTLIQRIESRVAIIKATNPGTDMAGIETQIKTAKDELDLVPPKINTLKADFDTLLASSTPKVLFKNILDEAKIIKTDLQGVHKILVHVIGDIKGLRVGETNDN